MKFHPLTETAGAGDLDGEYKAAHEIGLVRLGKSVLFFKSGFRTYFIPYEDVGRVFRRVVSVPARLCCGRGELNLEHLVVCDRDDRELAQIQLPDTKAARLLMEELQTAAPHASVGRPVQK